MGDCHKVLVVDDHRDSAALLARLLATDGHQAVTAHSCAEALLAARVDDFDLYLLDIGLPDGDGCDLLRDLARQRHIPAVALTGYAMEEDLRRAKAAGFDHVLVKPFLIDQLREVICRLCAAAEPITTK